MTRTLLTLFAVLAITGTSTAQAQPDPLAELRANIAGLRADIDGVKASVVAMKSDIAEIKTMLRAANQSQAAAPVATQPQLVFPAQPQVQAFPTVATYSTQMVQSFGYAQQGASGSCANGACGMSAATGRWYPGKMLGRRP